MGESLKFKEYCNRTVAVQYSERDFGEFSLTKILTLCSKMYEVFLAFYYYYYYHHN
jgi:uncharacterized HAD superfamily protein